MTTHEVLVASRNRIALKGWWKGGRDCTPGADCAFLALCIFTSDADARDAAARQVARAAGIDYTQPRDIYAWNDSQDSAEPILAAYDLAIAATAPAPADPFPEGVPEREAVA